MLNEQKIFLFQKNDPNKPSRFASVSRLISLQNMVYYQWVDIPKL